MTCIAGIEHEGKVWLAGDAEWSSKRVRSNSADAKVWVRDGILWGMSGDGRPADVLRYVARLPSRPRRAADVAPWMAADLVPAIRAALRADGSEGETEWAALVGVRGELWELDSGGYAAMRAAEGYAAVGCAQQSALVGLSLTASLTPRNRLIRVVNACGRHVPGVGGRVTVVAES